MIEFLFAPSGYGKTTKIFSSIRDDLQNDKKVMVIVPDQEAVSAEALCADITEGVPSVNLYVCSFSRLCNDAFRQYGGIAHTYADKTTGRLLVFLSARSVWEYLKVYGNITSADSAVISGVFSTIQEFKRNGITPQNVQKAAEMIDGTSRLKDKLDDIALIYDAYDSNLGSSVCDPCDDMSKLLSLLEKHDMFSQYDKIYIDSFHFFSALQYEVLSHIFACKADVTVSVCTTYNDDECGFSLEAVRQTKEKLFALAKRANAEITVSELTSPVRFLNGELKYLEEALRKDITASYESSSCVKTVECNTPFDEAEYVACTICNKIKNENARYKNFAVAVNSSQQWQGVIDAVFDKFNIPYFMSSRTDILQKPFVKLIFSAFNISRFDFYTEDVISYIKTGLTGLSYEETDLFETYVKRWGINGKRFYDSDWDMNPYGYGTRFSEKESEQLAVINKVRDYVITPLYDLAQALGAEDLTCEKILNVLYDFLIKINVKETLQQKAATAEDEAERSELYQIWGLFFKSASRLAEICGNTVVSAVEYISLLNMVLSEVDIGKIPTSQDQVIIGEVGRLRTDNPTDIFIMGVNEGDIPQKAVNNTVFTFADIKELSMCGISLMDDETVYMQDSFGFYKTATSSRKGVHITCCGKSTSNVQKNPSSLFLAISNIFKDGNFKFGGMTPNDIYTYSAAVDYAGRNLDQKSLQAVKKCLAENKETAHLTKQYDPVQKISKEISSVIYQGDLKLSQSKIKSFKDCKFGYYCKYILDLQDNSEIDVRANDLGTYVHYVLQRLLEEYIKGNITCDISEDDLKKQLDTFTDEFASFYLHINLKAQGYARISSLFEKMKRNTVKSARNLLKELAVSDFKPSRLELDISDNGAVSPLRVQLSDGTNAILGGIADRVDTYEKNGELYVKLIDYKTGANTFSLDGVAECKDIQLFVYMISICTNGKELFKKDIKPAAAFYVSVTPETAEYDHFENEDDISALAEQSIIRRGAALNDDEIKSAIFGNDPVFMPKSARDKKIAFITNEEFEKAFEELQIAITELSNTMKSGRAEPSPEKSGGRMACEFCKFKAVCRYENTAVNEDE